VNSDIENGRVGSDPDRGAGADAAGVRSVAIVGMACRYPDANDPSQLWQMVLDQRQAFRRLPPERLNLDDYLDHDRAAPDKTYASKAALLEGWTFDRAAFRIPGPAHRAADPAHWLALETASRALEDAGYPGGEGLDRDRVAVVIGNSLTGEVTRAATMRLRWPYVRRVLAAAIAEAGLSQDQGRVVIERSEAAYLAPFAPVGDETLAGGLSNTIAGRICNYFDFHGGGYTVDGACASSLLAVVTACRSLQDGSADVVLAGGVDLSIDPFELVGFAKTGALAADRMLVYDERSAGFVPGEGCGVVVLMRADDARAAGLRVYAEIAGWGVSSDGSGGITRPERRGQLLALRRAYELAGVDPSAVMLVEGHGTGTAVGDEIELSALMELRHGASKAAAIGSVKANIGHTKAASGVAGLIKATMSVASGVLPPTTGCERPHSALREAGAPLRVLAEPELWPHGPRLAGVSSMGFGGINAHIALRSAVSAQARAVTTPRYARRRPTPRTEVIALRGHDVAEVRDVLDRLVTLAPRLSEAELHDLACHVGRAVSDGPVRVALVADSPEQLAQRAAVAVSRLEDLQPHRLTAADGVFLGSAVAGRVTVLLPGQGAPVRADQGALGRHLTEAHRFDYALAVSDGDIRTAFAQPAIYRGSIAALRWLAWLGVAPDAAIGHSLGEIAGLVWAGCLTAEEGDRLVRERGRVMSALGHADTTMLSVAVDATGAHALCEGTRLVVAGYNGPRSHVLAGAKAEVHAVARRATSEGISAFVLPVSHAFHSPAMEDCVAEFKPCLEDVPFQAPVGRLVSSVRGRELTGQDDIAALLSEQITAPVRFWEAVTEVIGDTDLFCEVGPGRSLSALITAGCTTPVVGVDAGNPDDRALAETAAALFAAAAVPDLSTFFADRPARPIDVWRDRVFLSNPCSSIQGPRPAFADSAPAQPAQSAAGPDGPVSTDVAGTVLALLAEASELDVALIDPTARLLSDLHLTSLRVTQLVVSAAEAVGRERPIAPLIMADASVAELIETIEALPASGADAADVLVPGLAPWVRCFVEEQRYCSTAAVESRPGRWRAHIVPGHSLSEAAGEVFGGRHGEDADPAATDLVYVPDAAAPDSVATLLAAARAAISSGTLVAVTHGSALSGFLRALRLEHPEVGITLLRVPATAEGLRAAVRYAAVQPGGWRELVLDADCDVSEPVVRPLWNIGNGEMPLGPDDVLLVSGGGKGIGYECAAALARACGASLALVGRASPDRDEVLRANLDKLREAGVRAAYESVDVTDPVAVASGVRSLAQELGPITSLLHASGVNEPTRFDALDESLVRAHLAPKISGLRNVLAALDPRQLRVLVTFGSVIGRYGLAGECHYALANGGMRAEAERLAGELAECRVLNLDWSVWAGAGMGEQLGVLDALLRLDVTAIPVTEGVDTFLQLLQTPDLPTTVAVHGRVGGLLQAEAEQSVGRFVERVRVHYEGVELVADADLSLDRDSYLADHRIDGLAVLPAVAGLEAMAQAAGVLAGRPLRDAVDVTLDRPVVVPEDGVRTIRVCALRRGDAIQVALRSDETGHHVDHFRATFPLDEPAESVPVPALEDTDVQIGQDDLYGPLYFHTGRFRLVERFSALGARHCHVRLRAPDDHPDHPMTADVPLLGALTSNDATIHALQACVPHRRLLPVGCERLTVVPGAGATTEVYATERHAAHGEYVWDVVALDRFGERTLSWTGLRLRDVGPLPHAGPWRPPLLAVYLERCAAALGLDPRLQVEITTGDRHGARTSAAGTGGALEAFAETCRSYQNGVVLTVRAAGAACDWEPVAERSEHEWRRLLGPRFDALLDQVRTMSAEPVEVTAARIWTAVECLSKAGHPPSAPVVLAGVYDGGWVVLRTGSALIASVVVSVNGADVPVAISILTPDGSASERA
jgi:enediyne polyketide synthase